MYSKHDRAFLGKTKMITDPQYGNHLYNEVHHDEGITPPIVKGFLIQDNGFFILQDNGSFIEYT